MEPLLWILILVMTFSVAYSLQFSGATLAMGLEMAGTTTGTGLQDAINPPWETKFSQMVYIGCAVLLGVMWWQLGLLSALGGVAAIFFGAPIAKLLLPKVTGGHYRTLIIQSMCSRYTDFARDGNTLGVEAIKALLVRVGIDPQNSKSIV